MNAAVRLSRLYDSFIDTAPKRDSSSEAKLGETCRFVVMARPRSADRRVHTGFRCPPDLLAAAKTSAEEADVSFNVWVERAIRRYLAYLNAPEVPPRQPWSWKDAPDRGSPDRPHRSR